MAMFSQPRGDTVRDSNGRGAPKETALSIIAAGTRVVGEVDSDGLVKIEGTVVGSVRAGRQVLVAKGGTVEGDILTREAIIGGAIRGSILADERVEVQASSAVNGDITTQRIVIEEGGEVNGHVQMGNPNALSEGSRSLKAAESQSAPVQQ